MRTQPDDLPDHRIADNVAAAWGLRSDEVEHLPVGFGSHHWLVRSQEQRWFATVDDLVAKRHRSDEPLDGPHQRLHAALSSALSLRDAGLAFVVAPMPIPGGSVLHRIDHRYAMALYPYVEGAAHDQDAYPSSRARLAVIERLVALHQAPASATAEARVDDLVIPNRDSLSGALADLMSPWRAGPLAEPARALLGTYAAEVREVVEHYDALAAVVARKPERMVLTHGEPHPGNTITTPAGVMLIDWDTALVAPPERDLWSLADEDPRVLAAYADRAGVTPDGAALEVYRLWWDLAEIAGYVAMFRQPHRDTADTREAWSNLQHFLDPSRWR